LGLSNEAIGELIGRDRATVWKEIRCNGGSDGRCFTSVAHARACQRARRPKARNLAR
jgi:IS30 family transposase